MAEQSGAKSQVTGLVGAGVVALLLLVFNSLLADLPQTALAAVVIAAALSLMDLSVLRRYATVRRSARSPCRWSQPSGVVLFGVLQGILIAVVLSILLFFRRSWWPHGEVLGQVDELEGWHSIDRYPEATEDARRRRLPLGGTALLRQLGHLPASRCATSFAERDPRWVVLQCEAITDVDVTAADMLKRARRRAQRPGRPPGLRRAAGPAPRPRVALRPGRDARPRPLLPEHRGGARADIARDGNDPGEETSDPT